jgi:hypothetical protein
VFFGIEVTRKVVTAFVADAGRDAAGDQLDWRGVLDFLDRRLQSGDEAARLLVGTSFLFRLPLPGREGHAIVNELGDELARLFALARPNG